METLTNLVVKSVNINGWQVQICQEGEIVPQVIEGEARSLLDKFNQYCQRHADEGVWIQDFGAPSVLVGLNCTYDEKGLKVYSIDLDPKNLGIASVVNRELRKKLQKTLTTWPSFAVTNDLSFRDDSLWAAGKIIDIGDVGQNKNKMILFRGKDIKKEYTSFARQSGSVLFKRNSNAYGLELGLWKKVTYADLDALPWNQGFALKSITSPSNPFNIYLPFKYNGAISENRIIEKLSVQDMYLQDFIKPMRSENTGDMMMYKLFFAYNFEKDIYDYLSGIWLSRNNYRIHGTPETTFGPIIH